MLVRHDIAPGAITFFDHIGNGETDSLREVLLGRDGLSSTLVDFERSHLTSALPPSKSFICSDTDSLQKSDFDLFHSFITVRVVGLNLDVNLLADSPDSLGHSNLESSSLFVSKAQKASLEFLLVAKLLGLQALARYLLHGVPHSDVAEARIV